MKEYRAMKQYRASMRLTRMEFRRENLGEQSRLREYAMRDLANQLALALMKDAVEWEEFVDPPTGDLVISASVLIGERGEGRRYGYGLRDFSAADAFRYSTTIDEEMRRKQADMVNSLKEKISREAIDNLMSESFKKAQEAMALMPPLKFLDDRVAKKQTKNDAMNAALNRSLGEKAIAKATRKPGDAPLIEIAVRKIQLPEDGEATG